MLSHTVPIDPIPIPGSELYLATVLGAFVLYILSHNHGKQPFSPCRAFIRSATARAHGGIIFLDSLLSSFIGGAVVFLMTSPVTLPQAIVAGLGMAGFLSAAVKDDTAPVESKKVAKPELSEH